MTALSLLKHTNITNLLCLSMLVSKQIDLKVKVIYYCKISGSFHLSRRKWGVPSEFLEANDLESLGQGRIQGRPRMSFTQL